MDVIDIPKAAAWTLFAATVAAILGVLFFEIAAYRAARAARRTPIVTDEVRS